MGTRGLTIVINEEKTKVAQYGQWDHYPSGQGLIALKFLRSTNLENFKKRLKKVRFATDADQKAIDDFFISIGVEDGWMSRVQAKKYRQNFPLLSRGHGAKILDLLMKSEDEVFIVDSTDFAGDGLFCEWVYVIDLDKGTFEVYKGFGKKPLTKKDRFFFLQEDGSDYPPVKMVKSFKLNNLPTEDKFLAKFKREE